MGSFDFFFKIKKPLKNFFFRWDWLNLIGLGKFFFRIGTNKQGAADCFFRGLVYLPKGFFALGGFWFHFGRVIGKYSRASLDLFGFGKTLNISRTLEPGFWRAQFCLWDFFFFLFYLNRQWCKFFETPRCNWWAQGLEGGNRDRAYYFFGFMGS